jgi:hypothetical protein
VYAGQNFNFYGTWKFVTASVSAGHYPQPHDLRGSLQATHLLSPIKIQLYVTFLSGRYVPKWFSGKGTAYEPLYPSLAFYMPHYLTLFDLIPLIINHEKYKLRTSWKCSFLPLLFLSSKCFLQIQFLRHFQSTPPFRARSKITQPYRKEKWNYNFLYRNFCFFVLGSELLYSIYQRNLQSYGSYWCQWDEVMNYTNVHLSSISPQSINLFAFIFLHSVSMLLWPCDIYYLSFLLHAVSISSALTIFQFSAVQCHTVSTCYCRIIMTTNMS